MVLEYLAWCVLDMPNRQQAQPCQLLPGSGHLPGQSRQEGPPQADEDYGPHCDRQFLDPDNQKTWFRCLTDPKLLWTSGRDKLSIKRMAPELGIWVQGAAAMAPPSQAPRAPRPAQEGDGSLPPP